jgi:LacI family transcriptional regulator
MKPLKKVILLIPSAREYDRSLLRGIAKYTQIHGPWSFYEEPPSYLKPPIPQHRLEHMRNWQADGIIAPQTRVADLQALVLPTVILCGVRQEPPGIYQIRTGNEAIGEMASDYLQGLGLKQLAYCGLSGMEWSAIRGDSFRRHAAGAGIPVSLYDHAKQPSGESWFTEEARLGDWLEQLPKPVGLLACNDDRARMVAQICRSRGLRVPDDIALLGVDNDEHVCTRATPPLSSISLATERAGYEAAALLDALMAGKRPRNRILVVQPIGVVARQSTDLIASTDTNVVKAIRFILEHTHRVIRVSDVAKAAGLSRRVLQDRFAEVTGRKVLDAIHQSRVDHLKRLLTGTNLPLREIAVATGYDDTHLARFFTRRTGMTPSAYRKTHRKG